MSDRQVLPAAAYTQGEAFMREKAAIFALEWLPLAAVSQMPAAGDYVSHTVGGWPLLAVRGPDGALRAFRNNCRHQNMLILDQPAGHCEMLRCRYHGWIYGLDGRFREAPPVSAPGDPASDANHLLPLATQERDGLLFVHLDAAATDAPASSGRTAPAVTTTLEIGCNWKAYVEQRLAEGATFEWPLLISTDGRAEQVVPRSFLRTRVLLHGAASADPELVARCEAAQKARAGDEPGPADDRVDEFRKRVLAATA